MIYFHRDDERGPDLKFDEVGDTVALDAALARFREVVTTQGASSSYACLEWVRPTGPAKGEPQ